MHYIPAIPASAVMGVPIITGLFYPAVRPETKAEKKFTLETGIQATVTSFIMSPGLVLKSRAVYGERMSTRTNTFRLMRDNQFHFIYRDPRDREEF